MIEIKSDIIIIDQGNGRYYDIPTNELLRISNSWVKGEVYDWLMFLRKKDWFTIERGIELSFCMLAVADELGLVINYDILQRSWE
ncbi:MAG: hypothetical protein O3C22_04570 [Bacteroidetes bacterium]|nr:hypothetical protein [Bacteroidota bacterium]MDA0942821.1 hypothetical protein [Bacteroidota bacterium]